MNYYDNIYDIILIKTILKLLNTQFERTKTFFQKIEKQIFRFTRQNIFDRHVDFYITVTEPYHYDYLII